MAKKRAQEDEDDDLDLDGDKKKKKKKPKGELDDKDSKTKIFMKRFIANLRKLLGEEEVEKAMKNARGSAGGEMKKRRRISGSEGDLEAKTFDDDFGPAYRPKKSKEIVNYRDADTVGEQCNVCRFYLGGACRLVEGTILPDFSCDLFEVKLAIFNDNVADLCAGGHCNSDMLLFNELKEFADPPEWIPFLPKPGEYNSPKYGDIFITKERNENFIRNFVDGVYQEKLPISTEHHEDGEGAYGWIEEMRMNDDGSVDAKVLWTDRGTEAIKNDRFMYFSPEFHDVYKDNKEVVHKDVAVGGALTTRPFFKEDDLRPLVASEGVLTFNEGDNSITFTSAAHRRKEDDMHTSAKDKGGAGAPKEPGKFQQFRDGLTELLKKFGGDDEGEGDAGDLDIKDPAAPTPTGETDVKDPTAEELAEREKMAAAERFQSLEAENRALKASEAKHAAERKADSDRIEKLEMTEQRGRFEKLVMGEGVPENRWTGLAEEHINHLVSLKKAFGEDSKEFKHYVATQKKNVIAMNEGGLFDETGSIYGLEPSETTETPQGALEELKKKASEIIEKAPADAKPTHEQAMVIAGQENPKLKQKYREQFRSANTVKP